MNRRNRLSCKKYAYNSLYGFSNWYPILEQYFPKQHLIPSQIIYYDPEEYWKLLSLLEKKETLFLEEEITQDTYDAVRLKEALRMQFKDLLEKGDKAINEYGGRAFLKWNMIYPKDVCVLGGLGERLPGRMGNVCFYSSTFSFLIDTLSSIRIRKMIAEEEEQILYPLIVRKPIDIIHEVRVFIKDLHPVVATQYYIEEDMETDGAMIKPLGYFREVILFAMNVAMRLPFKNLTIDVGLNRETGHLVLVEVNPPLTSCATDIIVPFMITPIAIKSAIERRYTLVFFNRKGEVVRRRIRWGNRI